VVKTPGFISKDKFILLKINKLKQFAAEKMKKDKTRDFGQTVAPFRWLYLLIPKRRRAKRETAQTVTGAVVQQSN